MHKPSMSLPQIHYFIFMADIRFKEAMSGLLQGLLPVLVTRLHVVLSADWDWSGKLALAVTSVAAATSGPAGED